MNILNLALHRIDHTTSRIESITLSQNGQAVNKYVKELLKRITETENKRQFTFISDTAEVNLLIHRMIVNDDYSTAAEKIADRLMRKEQNAQSDIDHLVHEIQRGILIQAVVEVNSKRKMVIAKADDNEYLDGQEFENRKGLPIKRKLYKAILIEFNSKNLITDIFVFDTNATIAKYWWSDFLELYEVNSDEHNTELAFDAIDRSLLAKIKLKYPSDHNIIRNRALGYFKSKSVFKINQFIKQVVGDYDPVDKNFNVESFKEKLASLPDKRKFDTQFSIKAQVIRAKKLRNIVILNDQMDLHIKEHVKDLDETIAAFTYQGQKYIRIKTDAGYEAFKKNKS